MSTHYETLQNASTYRDAFNVAPPAALGPRDMRPRKTGTFIRRAAAAQPPVAQDTQPDAPPAPAVSPPRELIEAQWGLVPSWVKSESDGKLRAPKLVNARSETVSTSTPFREAWLNGQRCIVPMIAFFTDDFRSGKAVPTRISRIDGQPMGVAGLWACWKSPTGEELISYTLLTVNANSHALMHRYQQPGSEKRMPAVLNEGAYDAWLNARIEKAKEFMRQYPANWLAANPVENKANKVPHGLR
jgi:putative SOS response-associated peptidase YedK